MGYVPESLMAGQKAGVRTVVLASADRSFRARLRQELTAMRWEVREASGGAEAVAQLEMQAAEALVLDGALPDLEVGELARELRRLHPAMDLLRLDPEAQEVGPRSPRRNELLHALREAQRESSGRKEEAAGARQRSPVREMRENGRAATIQRPASSIPVPMHVPTNGREEPELEDWPGWEGDVVDCNSGARLLGDGERSSCTGGPAALAVRPRATPLPNMVGESAAMLELARMIRLVAPRSTSVLIEGETGTGKELVAKAVHLLSARARMPYVVLNCAAIPESLLEAELFGHTRGAFTGAVRSRTGRIEAADGGTLFLDEIGEMPLALQAKMLRFLESGELQRVGDNETVRVDVRIVSATHQHLRQQTVEHTFRLDLYHRLAVFPVFIPPLRERPEDVLPLAAYFLSRMGEEMPVKRLSAGAAQKLTEHDWPGNVRHLAHVLERGSILAEDRPFIEVEDIYF